MPNVIDFNEGHSILSKELADGKCFVFVDVTSLLEEEELKGLFVPELMRAVLTQTIFESYVDTVHIFAFPTCGEVLFTVPREAFLRVLDDVTGLTALHIVADKPVGKLLYLAIGGDRDEGSPEDIARDYLNKLALFSADKYSAGDSSVN